MKFINNMLGNYLNEFMLELLSKLKTRLNEINDGSFEIEDLITPEYENL